MKISYDDISCVCELADLFLQEKKSRGMIKFFSEERKIVDGLKWFVRQCESDSIVIIENPSK